eukprot:m.58088 g.58088  ORF g.58088 m.58088 type:complete len:91 (-) comp7851_c0_seq1:902-1174(-)
MVMMVMMVLMVMMVKMMNWKRNGQSKLLQHTLQARRTAMDNAKDVVANNEWNKASYFCLDLLVSFQVLKNTSIKKTQESRASSGYDILID